MLQTAFMPPTKSPRQPWATSGDRYVKKIMAGSSGKKSKTHVIHYSGAATRTSPAPPGSGHALPLLIAELHVHKNAVRAVWNCIRNAARIRCRQRWAECRNLRRRHRELALVIGQV